MDQANPPARLLHFRVSHYNEKVRWALDFKAWPHVREAQVPAFHVPRVRGLSGQNKVPVLIVDGEVWVGSSQIIAAIERARPEPALYPADPAQLERALAIEKYFDDEVAPALRRLFWSTYFPRPADCARLATDGFSGSTRFVWRALFPLLRPILRRNMGANAANVALARERLGGYFERVEAEIGPSGYLVGDRFGLADLAVASVMTAIVRPPEFPYPLPEPWPPELLDLRGSVAERGGFRWVLEMYTKHRGQSCEI